MKKRLLGLMVLLLVAFLVPLAASANQIGYVDLELLFEAHPEYDQKNKELREAAKEFYEEFQREAEELEASAVEELGASYEQKLHVLEQEVRGYLISFILETIADVADEAQVSVVLWENSVLYGGVDLTPLVVESMYKVYGISVPLYIRDLL